MIKLETLPGDKGAKQKRKRVGRGESSGWGKTAGKGNKGAQARSGTPKGKGFEGGQTPISRRLPKRGFSNKPWAVPTVAINIARLNRFEDGATINFEAFLIAGMIGVNTKRIKILGNGELTKKLTVMASAFSATAREKIEKSGGSCQEIELDSM